MTADWQHLTELADRAPSGHAIVATCSDICRMLLEKNTAYGDSALHPIRIFSRADAMEQIRVRIDDKLNRLAQGRGDTEDTRRDLIGYLILLEVAEQRHEDHFMIDPAKLNGNAATKGIDVT